MKNKEIVTIVEGGLLAATAHSLPPEHFYKFVRFKRECRKAYQTISAAQRDFLAEAGIKPEEAARPESVPAKKWDAFVALNNAMLDEQAEITEARIPMKLYKGIYDENKTGEKDIFADMAVEDIILDNLFKEDKDNGE